MHYERIQNVKRVNANAYEKIMKRKPSVIGAARKLHRVAWSRVWAGTHTPSHSHTHPHAVCPPCLNADYRLHADMPTGKIKHSVNARQSRRGCRDAGRGRVAAEGSKHSGKCVCVLQVVASAACRKWSQAAFVSAWPSIKFC